MTNQIEQHQFRYQQTSSPAADIVTIVSAKDFARYDETGDTAHDARQTRMFRNLIDTAIDRFQKYTGKQIRATGFTATLDCTPYACWLYLKQRPIISVDKIYALDTDDTETEMAATDFQYDSEFSKIIGTDWPSGTKDIGSFNIDYTSGLATQVDGTLNAAILADDTTITVKDLSTAPNTTGVVTITKTTARESYDYISVTESGGIYTFVLETPIITGFAEDDVVNVLSAPHDVKTFILQTVAFWYDVRMSGGEHDINTYPGHAQSLLNQNKTKRM